MVPKVVLLKNVLSTGLAQNSAVGSWGRILTRCIQDCSLKNLCSVNLASCLAAHIFFKVLCLLYASLQPLICTWLLKWSLVFWRCHLHLCTSSRLCTACILFHVSFPTSAFSSCDPEFFILPLFLVSLSRSGVIQGLLVFALAVLCGMQHLMASCRIDFNRVSVVAVPLISCISMFSPFIVFHFVSFHSALVYNHNGIWHLFCFLLCALVINSHYGMSWSDKPNMTSTWGTSCGQLVRISPTCPSRLAPGQAVPDHGLRSC